LAMLTNRHQIFGNLDKYSPKNKHFCPFAPLVYFWYILR
jgi:hypothetical protein